MSSLAGNMPQKGHIPSQGECLDAIQKSPNKWVEFICWIEDGEVKVQLFSGPLAWRESLSMEKKLKKSGLEVRSASDFAS